MKNSMPLHEMIASDLDRTSLCDNRPEARPWAVALVLDGCDLELVNEHFPTADEAERFGVACFAPLHFTVVRTDQ